VRLSIPSAASAAHQTLGLPLSRVWLRAGSMRRLQNEGLTAAQVTVKSHRGKADGRRGRWKALAVAHGSYGRWTALAENRPVFR